MTRPPAALPGWLLADLAPVLRLAATLTGSAPGAAGLVADVLARDRSWTATGEGYDLQPRWRTAVVRTFLGSPLGRASPIPGDAAGLDALPGPVRAAVVLRDGEQLTVGEIASVLDRPARQVAAELARVSPGRYDAELAELTAIAPDPEAVAARFGPSLRAVRRSRRRRTTLLGVAAVVIAAAVAVPTVVLPRLPVAVRAPGEWRYSHEVTLAPGWQLAGRAIEETTETSLLQIPWVGDDPASCTVTVRVRGVEPEREGVTKPITVRQRPGELVTRPGNAVSVHWEYADDAWASVDCDAAAAVSEALQLQIAAATRFRDRRQALPFRLTELPEGYRIQTVGENYQPTYGAVGTGPGVLLVPPENSFRAAIVIGPDLGGTVDAIPSSCLGPTRQVCVSAFQTDDQVPPNTAMLRRAVADTVGDVVLASDPADRSTWFDAIDLPSP